MIETSIPVMKDPNKIIQRIAAFWNDVSFGWQEIWGHHIHHGFYDADTENQINNQDIQNKQNKHNICDHQLAQDILVDKLLELLDKTPKTRILDVGCGMGKTALYLAEKLDAEVIGITLSEKQIKLANNLISNRGITLPRIQPEFLIEDAHALHKFSDHTFDLVWSLESCEQFYDKRLFLEQANRVLKPGGQLMLATWCADAEHYEGEKAKQYLKICKVFDLPYMPTISHYSKLLKEYFRVDSVFDWSKSVAPSWKFGREKLQQYSLFKLLRLGGIKGLIFARKLKLMEQAFETGQLRYGVFVATKT